MGGLKNFNVKGKIRMQSTWVKRLFEDDFQDWKVITLFLKCKHLAQNFIIV